MQFGARRGVSALPPTSWSFGAVVSRRVLGHGVSQPQIGPKPSTVQAALLLTPGLPDADLSTGTAGGGNQDATAPSQPLYLPCTRCLCPSQPQPRPRPCISSPAGLCRNSPAAAGLLWGHTSTSQIPGARRAVSGREMQVTCWLLHAGEGWNSTSAPILHNSVTSSARFVGRVTAKLCSSLQRGLAIASLDPFRSDVKMVCITVLTWSDDKYVEAVCMNIDLFQSCWACWREAL